MNLKNRAIVNNQVFQIIMIQLMIIGATYTYVPSQGGNLDGKKIKIYLGWLIYNAESPFITNCGD